MKMAKSLAEPGLEEAVSRTSFDWGVRAIQS